MQTFQDLLVWQKAHQLVLDVYRMTERFPSYELYGLTSQMRRAAISISANIVEGHKRRSRREFARYMSIAEGSLDELKYHFELSKDLGYLAQEHWNLAYDAADELGRMLHAFKRHIKRELRDDTATMAPI